LLVGTAFSGLELELSETGAVGNGNGVGITPREPFLSLEGGELPGFVFGCGSRI